jgi:hypothetical protein
MKRILSLITISLVAITAGAQNYENIKTMVTLTQYQKAKEEVDKNMANAKFISKPEAFILKTAIYGALSMDQAKKGTPEADQLTTDGDAAFTKFKEMDPSMALLSDLVYQNGPLNIYYSYYTQGYALYSTKKWDAAYVKLKKAVDYSDLLISKKILTIPMDTNVLILAGVTAENSSNKEDAIKYYARLADAKIAGEGFESVYRYLVAYYFGKKDMTNFEKYKAIGKEMYPKSDYFSFDKVDFAVGLQEKLDDKIKAVEEVLATDPANFKANQVMGEIIYDALNPKEETDPLPANAAELEKKMIDGFTKAAAAKPNYEIPFVYMGDHFINKAVKVNEEREKHAADMKARTKPGTMASKEDVAKRDALDKKYGEELIQAQDPYEKAAAIYATKGTLELRDKQQYKKAVSYLADIFAFKKIQARNKKSPDAAKFEAEEKKWNSLWETIK